MVKCSIWMTRRAAISYTSAPRYTRTLSIFYSRPRPPERNPLCTSSSSDPNIMPLLHPPKNVTLVTKKTGKALKDLKNKNKKTKKAKTGAPQL